MKEIYLYCTLAVFPLNRLNKIGELLISPAAIINLEFTVFKIFYFKLKLTFNLFNLIDLSNE